MRTLLYEEATIDDPDVSATTGFSIMLLSASLTHFSFLVQLEMRWTPLHYAIMGGHPRIVEILIEKAPVRRITINRKDVRGFEITEFMTSMQRFEMSLLPETWHDSLDACTSRITAVVCLTWDINEPTIMSTDNAGVWGRPRRHRQDLAQEESFHR